MARATVPGPITPQGDNCTNGHCDRRGEYLKAATAICWSPTWSGWPRNGAPTAERPARSPAGRRTKRGHLSAMLTGMGSLSYGEQAGERMRLGLMLNDPEEEHDCFSDNTHNSHYYDDGLGIQNVYLGELYPHEMGTPVSGRISGRSGHRHRSGAGYRDAERNWPPPCEALGQASRSTAEAGFCL